MPLDMMCRSQNGLEIVEHAAVVIEGQPQRHGVDEQADHPLDLQQFGRTARHRDAEHDVVLATVAGQYRCPCELDQRVQGHAMLSRERSQRGAAVMVEHQPARSSRSIGRRTSSGR